MESVPRADGSVGTDSGTGSAGNHLEPPARVVSIMSLGIASACDEYQSLGAASALLHRYQCVAVTDDYQVLGQRQSPKILRLWDGSEWVHRVYSSLISHRICFISTCWGLYYLLNTNIIFPYT